MIYLPVTPPQPQLPLYILSNPTHYSPLHDFVPLRMPFPLLVPTSFPSLLQSLSYNSLPLPSHPFFNLYSKLKLYFTCSLLQHCSHLVEIFSLYFQSLLSNGACFLSLYSTVCGSTYDMLHTECSGNPVSAYEYPVYSFHHIPRIQSSYKPTT